MSVWPLPLVAVLSIALAGCETPPVAPADPPARPSAPAQPPPEPHATEAQALPSPEKPHRTDDEAPAPDLARRLLDEGVVPDAAGLFSDDDGSTAMVQITPSSAGNTPRDAQGIEHRRARGENLAGNFRRKPKPEVEVTLAGLKLEGPCDKAHVSRVLDETKRALLNCYKRFLKDTELYGDVVVAWTIRLDGYGSDAAPRGGSLDDARVGNCVAERIKHTPFDAPEDDEVCEALARLAFDARSR